MGYIKHHAIVITGYDLQKLLTLRGAICEIIDSAFAEEFKSNESTNMVTEILESGTNGYCTFFVAPDGSKEGWQTSNIGDNCRAKIVQLCEEFEYCGYAELFYGEDNGNAKIVNHN